jgi:hypothetical protein
MNYAIQTEIDISSGSRHNFLFLAKKQISSIDCKLFNYYIDMAEKEQERIEKLNTWHPGCQL